MDPKQLVENVRAYWEEEKKQPGPRRQSKSAGGRRSAKRGGSSRPVTADHARSFYKERDVKVKDWKYWRKNAYRGGGAIWTDPSVHCPPELQHWIGRRPDLDEKHEQYVQKKMQEEHRFESMRMKHTTDEKVKQQIRFQKQREHNHLVETGQVGPSPARGGSRRSMHSRPGTAPVRGRQGSIDEEVSIESSGTVELDPRVTIDGNAIKDQKYYRRNGAMWTDLIHTVPDRLHFVLNDKIIDADRRAADLIRQKYEEERAEEEMKEIAKFEKARAIREHFQQRQKFHSKVPKHTKIGKVSARIEELARPKTAKDAYAEAGPYDGIDFKGLLVVDRTVGELVRNRAKKNLKRQMTAAMSKSGGNGSSIFSVPNGDGQRQTQQRKGARGSAGGGAAKGSSRRARTSPGMSRKQRQSTPPREKKPAIRHSPDGIMPQRPSTGNAVGQQGSGSVASIRATAGARPLTAPAWAPGSQSHMHSQWGDVSMEGVVPSMEDRSLVSAMLREVQGTMEELETFEDRRVMVERRRKIEGPENWFREETDKGKGRPQSGRPTKRGPAAKPASGRPSTAPVGARKEDKNNNKRTSNNPNWFDDLKKKETNAKAGNYWSFLNSKNGSGKEAATAGRYTRKGFQQRRRGAAKLAKETKE